MLELTNKNTPTLDIYFRQPLSDLIAEGLFSLSKRPIRRLGPNSFFAHGKAVIIRYATQAELAKIGSLSPRHCYYLIDDDFSVLDSDKSIPEDYRQKLLHFSREILPKILSLADVIVAPNHLIHKGYPNKKHLLLNPSYHSICQDFSHFEQNSTIDILFSGTRSHLNDLLFISDVMVNICKNYPHVRFISFMGHHAPDNLKGIDNILHRKACSWGDFRRIMERERYHICLASCLDTPFNRARSVNKILDHAAFGAAGIYSDRPFFAETVRHEINGLLVKDHPESWYRSIEKLVTDMQNSQCLAREGCALAIKLGSPENSRRFWMEELSIQRDRLT